LRPGRDGFLPPQDSPLRKISENGAGSLGDAASDERPRNRTPAPSRIGSVPVYGLSAASGAAQVGFDSLNRTRRRPKYYPGQARPRAPGPGTPAPAATAPASSNGRVRLSVPPSETAHKPPIPPAMAGTVDGQPPRRRLKTDDDPFGAVGDYAGSFLIKSAVELRGGYDTNPGRLPVPIGDPLWVVAPEFLAVSDWERHALVADLRGSFTGYGHSLPPIVDGAISAAPTDINRPDFLGHVDGRLDVTEDTRITSQLRLRVATDNPGSPNIQAGLARYPDYATFGTTVGIDQRFNRLDIAAGATFDRTVYQNSLLTDGTISSNADRAYNQYGGVGRVSYELTPAVKPFVEVEGDSRFHDQLIDNSGYARNSNGGYARAGTSFELSRLLIGEISIGCTRLSGSPPQSDCGILECVLADLDRNAADHGQILFHHLDRRSHRARRLRRADAHLHLRGRSRFPTLADGDRQVHLRHLQLSGRWTVRSNLLARGRRALQADPLSLAQGHTAVE